jgi:hypothetical protein
MMTSSWTSFRGSSSAHSHERPVASFQRTYDAQWIIRRHGCRAPAQVGREQTAMMQTAA